MLERFPWAICNKHSFLVVHPAMKLHKEDREYAGKICLFKSRDWAREILKGLKEEDHYTPALDMHVEQLPITCPSELGMEEITLLDTEETFMKV